MSGEEQIPSDRQYTRQHEWVRAESGELVIGITDHAQAELTDIVYVNVPPAGRTVRAGESLLVLESVKTVADVYAPAAGQITGGNEELRTHPELINQDPYGRGWIVRFRPDGPPTGLLDAEEYRRHVAAGASGA